MKTFRLSNKVVMQKARQKIPNADKIIETPEIDFAFLWVFAKKRNKDGISVDHAFNLLQNKDMLLFWQK